MSKFICSGNIYELVGEKEDVITLSISLHNLPSQIEAEGYTLYFPNFFHVSLVYIGRLIEKYKIAIPDFKNRIIKDFCEFTKIHNVELVCYSDNYRFVSKPDRDIKTVVVLCEISNLDKFFYLINKKYTLKIKPMTTHVTLYNTAKGEPGMYLMDEDDLRSFTKQIKNPLGFSLEKI